MMKNFKSIIYQRISEGDVEGAIDLLMEILQERKDNKTFNDALFLKSNLHSAKQQYEIKGVIARQEYELIVNKTLLGLESILDRLENGTSKTPMPEFGQPTNASPQEVKIPLWVGLILGALLISVVLYFVIDNTTVKESATSPLNQAIANWQAANFQNTIGDLEIIRNEGEPELQGLAEARLNWLAPFGSRHFFFADDFEEPPANQRWEYGQGVPGPGEFLIRQTNEGKILQLIGHEHAYPQADFPERAIVEVQLRFQMISDEPAGLHINLCMGLPPPYTRTTVGFYQAEKRMSIWGETDDPAGEGENERSIGIDLQPEQWYHFQAMIDASYVKILIDGEPVLDFESRRGSIPLQGFNLESLGGVVQIDNFLVVGP